MGVDSCTFIQKNIGAVEPFTEPPFLFFSEEHETRSFLKKNPLPLRWSLVPGRFTVPKVNQPRRRHHREEDRSAGCGKCSPLPISNRKFSSGN